MAHQPGPQPDIRAVIGTCRAAMPVATFSGTGRMLGDSPIFDSLTETQSWWECGQEAVAEYEYECPMGHTKRRANCLEHEPIPGEVGCRECFDAGAERPMTFRRAEGA